MPSKPLGHRVPNNPRGDFGRPFSFQENTMYTIRVNDNCIIREYTTDTYFNATALFHALQAKFSKVQVFSRDGVLKLETV